MDGWMDGLLLLDSDGGVCFNVSETLLKVHRVGCIHLTILPLIRVKVFFFLVTVGSDGKVLRYTTLLASEAVLFLAH